MNINMINIINYINGFKKIKKIKKIFFTWHDTQLQLKLMKYLNKTDII